MDHWELNIVEHVNTKHDQSTVLHAVFVEPSCHIAKSIYQTQILSNWIQLGDRLEVATF